MSLLIWVAGVGAVPAFFVMIIVLAIVFALATIAKKFRMHQAHFIRERLSLFAEVLSSMRVVKFYAWEAFFLSRVLRVSL